jgi:RNA polymerase sigma-70 factor (ECF subfamily)
MQNLAADERLIEALRAGDPNAAEELAAKYGPMIHQLALRYMKNWEDAQEVAQDVLMKAVQKIALFRGDAALSSWLYRITFNTAMSRLRNGRFSRPSEVREADLSPSTGTGVSVLDRADWSSMGDERVMRRQMREALVAALRELPAVYRVPIVLRDIHGLSTEEASRLLRVKTQTLKSRLHRGRIFLRERLAGFAGGLSLHNPVEA